MSANYKTIHQNVSDTDTALLVKVINDPARDMLENRVPKRKYFSNICNTNATPNTLSPLITSPTLFRIPSSASQMRIASSSTLDTLVGTGAQLVLIQGLDTNLVFSQEIVAMNGQTPTTTSNSYLRINNMFVISAGNAGGVFNGNQGNIFLGALTGSFATATGFADGNFNVMRLLDNSSGSPLCTVPKGESYYPLGIKSSGTQNASVQFKFYYRPTVNSGVFNYLDESICNSVYMVNTFIGGAGISSGEFLVLNGVNQGTAGNASAYTYAFSVTRKNYDEGGIF